MKLIIDIPEEIKAVIDRKGTNEIVAETLWQAVKNGVPLPKGHGRLIDADAYAKKYDTSINGRIGEEYVIAPTIIDTDNAESEKKE